MRQFQTTIMKGVFDYSKNYAHKMSNNVMVMDFLFSLKYRTAYLSS